MPAFSSTQPPPSEPGHDPLAQTLAFIQPWIAYVPQQQRRLGVFIFLAFLLHVAAFFFVRIDSSRAEIQHRTRIHVTMESSQAVALDGSAANDFWDRLTDPRVFLLPQPAVAPFNPTLNLLSVDSRLGSGNPPPPAAPEEFRLSQAVTAPLEKRAEAAMLPVRPRFMYDETPPRIAAKTTWQWDDRLAARQPSGVKELPSPVSDTDLLPTQLQVSVDERGTVTHVLVEQSTGSGRLDLDQQAVLAARKVRFAPVDQPAELWGRLTIFWRYSPKPREDVVPTPPTAQ